MRTIEEIKSQFLSLKAPFVWSLKLTADEFENLRNFIDEHHTSDCYPLVMIYVAEWYKRSYDINSRINNVLTWFDAESVWKGSGFRAYNQWVYCSERGKEWLYSMYILGGLASRLECGHPDDRLLEQLCRLYHGEELTLSAAGGRAIALSQSIEREGSLFYFIQEIINGRFPYAQSDVEDKSSPIYGLVKLLRSANRRALRDKFNCEWIINYADFYETMSRRLRLGLRPERGASGQRQYLSYERLESWGFQNPGEIARIRISLQFSCDGDIIKSADFSNPVLTYSNTGNDDNGFLAWGSKDAAVSDRIPNRFFSSVEVMVQATRVDGSLEMRPVSADADFPEFLQVYRIANRMSEWSSRQRNGATAVVYNKSCKVVAPSDAKVVEKPFYLFSDKDNEPRESEPYCWTDIDDSVLIRDKFGIEKKLYNRTGGYDLFIRRYDDVISYGADGMVKHIFRNDSDSEWQDEMLPLLFGLDGLEIRKSTQDSETFEIVEPERIYARQKGSVIKDLDSLTEGVTDFIITLQGKERVKKVWYIPYRGESAPIERDFINREIRVFDGTTVSVPNENLIVEVERGDEMDKVIIPVFAPIEGHEVWIDNKLIERAPLNEDLLIPFLNCEYFAVKTIDKKGIHITTGEELRDHYYDAPDQGLGDSVTMGIVKANGVTMYLFNPESKTELKPVSGGVKLPVYSDVHPRHYGRPAFPKSNPFVRSAGISIIDAFETAVEYGTYFFVFKEIKRGVKDERLINELFIPLAKKGRTDNKTMKALWRLAFEFHFDWMLLPRSQWEKVSLNMRDMVKELFLTTPKAVNEYEKRQLEIFVDEYWDFNDYSTTDEVGKTALKMILGQTGDTPSARHTAMFKFIRDYDHSTVKFHEMTKTITK
ncbi:MAG: hypothetical protein HDR38_07270 [Treponema sp.]|nr:hypothetical protein [Treponema sp.]